MGNTASFDLNIVGGVKMDDDWAFVWEVCGVRDRVSNDVLRRRLDPASQCKVQFIRPAEFGIPHRQIVVVELIVVA